MMVIVLLETLYVLTMSIYRVQLQCYVAATGLPTPRKDHTVAMCRFARDIMARMHVLTKELEVLLGPDTGDLNLRIGIHSGPITAGVIRGAQARFQLFGGRYLAER